MTSRVNCIQSSISCSFLENVSLTAKCDHIKFPKKKQTILSVVRCVLRQCNQPLHKLCGNNGFYAIGVGFFAKQINKILVKCCCGKLSWLDWVVQTRESEIDATVEGNLNVSKKSLSSVHYLRKQEMYLCHRAAHAGYDKSSGIANLSVCDSRSIWTLYFEHKR